MQIKSNNPKRSVVYLIIIILLLVSYFGIQITYTITLNHTVPKSEAELLFKKYSLNVNLMYYPVGYSLVVPIRNPKSVSNEMLLHGLSDQLRELDRKTYGDKFIVIGSGSRGGGIFDIGGNDRGTPEMLKELVGQIPLLDADSARIEFPWKVFYTHSPFLTGSLKAIQMRHDSRVKSVETGITSLPIIFLLQSIVRLGFKSIPH